MSSKPLELEGLGVEPESQTPVILLREPDSDTQIPIWIGEQEAMAIAAELEDVTPPRRGPIGPDDDADFLWDLGKERRRTGGSDSDKGDEPPAPTGAA